MGRPVVASAPRSTAAAAVRRWPRKWWPVAQRETAEGGWEDNNHRVIFYCPNDLKAAIEASMASTSRSKTRVIVDALRVQLLDGATTAEEPSS